MIGPNHEETACGVCGEAPDGGHMGEECPNESGDEQDARHEREKAKLPTAMPKPARGCVHRSRCHNATIRADFAGGVVKGSCDACGQVVARQNPRTTALEWLNGADPGTAWDAPGGPGPSEGVARKALAARELAVVAEGRPVPDDFAREFLHGVLCSAAFESLSFFTRCVELSEEKPPHEAVRAALAHAREALGKARRGEAWR